jgi:hypothetical protein
MNRAGTNDHQQAFTILSMQHPADGFSCLNDESSRLVGDGQFRFDGARGGQRLDFYDVLVVDGFIHADQI